MRSSLGAAATIFALLPFYTIAIEESIILKGDIYIGGLFSIQKNRNGQCDKIAYDSVMHLEAVSWVIQQLNSVGYIPGLKIGLIAFRTCGLKELSAFYTNRLIQMSQSHMWDSLMLNSSKKVIGIIGPEYNDEAKVVAKILGMLPVSQQMANIGFSTGLKELSNKEEYPTFIRTMPSDEIQLKVTYELLVELEWNYVTIIHENDTYNTDLAYILKQLVQVSRICVPVVHSLHLGIGGINPDEIQQILKEITLKEDPAIRGVVFFGSTDVAHALLLKTDVLKVNKKPLFIFNGGLALKEETFEENGQVIGAAKGVLLISPIRIEVKPFLDYWLRLFQNQSRLLDESKVNRWLLDLFEEEYGCRPSVEALCSTDNIKTQSLYLSYAIKAIYAFSRTLKVIHEDLCNGGEGFCNGLRNLPMIVFYERLMSLHYDIENDLQNYSLNLSNSMYGFQNEFRDDSAFAVYNYQVNPQNTEKFYLREVAVFRNESIELQKSSLKHYTIDGSEVTTLPTAQCEAGKVCLKCMQNNAEAYYVPGDYVVVIGVAIRNKANSPTECSEMRTSVGLDLALGAIYIAEKVNEKNGTYHKLFVNKTIGVLIIDTCNAPLVTQKRILYLKEIAMKAGAPSDILDRILFFVGGVGSTLTLEYAKLTSTLKMPHIGFASTSPRLSDREVYPFFHRVSMPLNKQIEGMIKLTKLIDADYLQVIYNSGEYGEAAKKMLMDISKSYNICIAQEPIEVSEGSTYYSILPKLRKKPHASLVLVILRSHVGPHVAKVLNEEMDYREFTFIGAEAWGSRNEYLKNLKLEESITFAQDIPKNEGYESYLRKQVPVAVELNPWLAEFFQKRLNCYFPWSFDKTMARPCGEFDTLPGPTTLDPWTPYLMRAVEAGLFGIDEALEKMCGETQPLCENFRIRADEVMNYIKDVHLNNARVFDSNGDGILGYTIYNIQKNPNDPLKLIYKKVGKWTADGKLDILRSSIKYSSQPSRCPNEKACNCTPVEKDPVVITNNMDDTGITLSFIAVTSVLCLIILVLLQVLFLLWRKLGCSKDPSYLNPVFEADNLYHIAVDRF